MEDGNLMTHFVKQMLEKAKSGELHLKRSIPTSETKFNYHIVIEDPVSKRVVVTTGSDGYEYFSWGMEISKEEVNLYL